MAIDVFATVVCLNPEILAEESALRALLSGNGNVSLISSIILLILERERAMLFPDYYFFAKRRLENYTIETRTVKNLADCELMCYLNDNCVSLNYKKGPDNNDPVHICELNNVTHLKYDRDLTTDDNFYYRGSKVSYKSIFRNCRLGITIINVYANFRAFDHSVFSFSFHSIPPSFLHYLIFFSPSERL